MKYEIKKEKIAYFEDVFEDIDAVLSAIEELNSKAVSPWERWDTGDPDNSYGDVKFLRRRYLKDEQDPVVRDKAEWLLDTLTDAMGTCATEYAELFDIDEISLAYAVRSMRHPSATTGINKYLPGKEMGPHIDWNEDNVDVEYTIVVYLNDDYVGGELHFVEPELDVKIKPKAGSIVVFPSFMPYKHKSCHIESGRKMLITHHWKGGDRAKRIRKLVTMLREGATNEAN